MASKAPHTSHSFEMPDYRTIEPVDIERANARARELQARAVRDTFAGLFRAFFGLLRGARHMGRDARKGPPLATSSSS